MNLEKLVDKYTEDIKKICYKASVLAFTVGFVFGFFCCLKFMFIKGI